MSRTIRVVSMLVLAVTVGFQTRSKAQTDDHTDTSAVFVMTNAADRNEIISYLRTENGGLQKVGRFATGGRGSGGNTDPLESQGSLSLSDDHSLLFAVNAGSGEITTFRVHGGTLTLAGRVPSGGSEPVAVAEHENLLYVLNTGGSSEVVGFHVTGGKLTQIPDSVRFLSTNTSGAASLSFSPDGQFLAITERLTNRIDVFDVQGDGTLSPIVSNQSANPGVFAVLFAPNGSALISETGPAGVPNGSTITSYEVLADGTLSAVSSAVPTLGAANCWNAVTPDGRFVYTSNAGSSTISGFAIAPNGTLTPLPGTVVGTNPSGATNLDIAVSSDGKFLYTLNSGNGTVGIFAIQKDGTLINTGSVGGILPSHGFNGIAAN